MCIALGAFKKSVKCDHNTEEYRGMSLPPYRQQAKALPNADQISNVNCDFLGVGEWDMITLFKSIEVCQCLLSSTSESMFRKPFPNANRISICKLCLSGGRWAVITKRSCIDR